LYGSEKTILGVGLKAYFSQSENKGGKTTQKGNSVGNKKHSPKEP
tara:strand:+ start:448 stop:582 length:135 start_codon:yes stop_codon:yes gene_type:complete